MGYNCDMRLGRSDFAPIFWLTIAAALLLMPLPPDPSWNWFSLFRELQNLLHFPLFAVLASVTFRACRARMPRPGHPPLLRVMAAMAAFALVTEGLQAMVGREPSWRDLLMDLLGAGSALLLHARAEISHSRRSRLAGSGLLLAAVASALVAAWPFLWTTAAYAYRASVSPIIWNGGSPLLARFAHRQQGDFPGLHIHEPPRDWEGWKGLRVRVTNRSDKPLPIAIRIHDRHHDLRHEDRYNRTFLLEPARTQELSISLEEVRTAPQGRTMDLRAIRGVIVFSPAGQEHGFDVLEVRLEK